MKKVLVIYFSLTGTTRNVAQSISDLINADIYQIEAEHPYTRADLDWTIADSRANREQNTEIARPAYKGKLPDVSRYDTIIIGHPIWWGMPPKIVHTVLDDLDLTGKNLVSFATSGGSSYYDSQKMMEKWIGHKLPKGRIFNHSTDVKSWLASLEFLGD